jgi:hypothetical protein
MFEQSSASVAKAWRGLFVIKESHHGALVLAGLVAFPQRRRTFPWTERETAKEDI